MVFFVLHKYVDLLFYIYATYRLKKKINKCRTERATDTSEHEFNQCTDVLYLKGLRIKSFRWVLADSGTS